MRVIHFSKNLAVSMFCVASCFQLQAQQTPLSEIFFLDLGIVIEPSNGNNKFSRTVDKPSEEVAFKVKRAESGSVYMASSKELLSTLDRLNDRIENLEQSFKDEIASMKERNDNLQNLLVDGRVAEGRGGHTGGGDAGNLGAALQGAGEVGHVAAWGVDGLWAG